MEANKVGDDRSKKGVKEAEVKRERQGSEVVEVADVNRERQGSEELEVAEGGKATEFPEAGKGRNRQKQEWK